jgi:hypothetical protein
MARRRGRKEVSDMSRNMLHISKLEEFKQWLVR